MISADRHTIINVIGGLMRSPALLSDMDKYQLTVDDFADTLDRYIFIAIFNLYQNGAEEIHSADIENVLENNSTAKNLLEKQNGRQYLANCEEIGRDKAFSYYYNKLKKYNLLRDLQKEGYDISSFYAENTLAPDAFEINGKFEFLTVEKILNDIKGKVSLVEKNYLKNNAVFEGRAVDGIRDLIVELKQNPEVGCHLQGEIFNTVCRGGRKGKLYIRSASSGIGKALPNYTQIPTTEGWKTVGQIKVGDYLFDRKGNPTKVLAVYPQNEKKQIFKVYFKSGRVAECCEEHLWSYYSNGNNRNPNKLITKTLKEIINNPKGLTNSSGQYRWSVPICEPIQYSTKTYSINPYVMGLIMGDGSFRFNQSNKSFNFSSSDEELVISIKEKMGYISYKRNSEKNYNWTFKSNDFNNHENVWVEDILKDYPELWQLKSEDKFIPQDYLLGDVEQRYDLLAGLLDTDGSIDEKGRINFTTISPKLRDNVIELCESLGMTCSFGIDKREQYTTGECYNIHIQAKKEDKVKIFKLNRKLERAKAYVNNGKRAEKRDRDNIIKIEPTNQFVDMTCFYVDNKEHLFLMNNFICTHNTRQAVGDACNIAYPIRFDIQKQEWVEVNRNPEKVLYIMTEQDPTEIQTMILAYLTGYNEEMFLYGTYGENEMPRIMKAVEIMEQYQDYLLTAQVPNPCAGVIKNLFRRYNFQEGVENFFYDYIFSSPAMLDEYRDLAIREDVCLRMFATELKNLAVELNAFVMTSTQISNDNNNDEGGFRDFKFIRGSKAIVDVADLACIMSRPSQKELETLGQLGEFVEQPNLVIDIFKNRRGRWTQVRIWSKNDLGCCRREDLFITNIRLEPIQGFKIANFSQQDNGYEIIEFNQDEISSEKELVIFNNKEEAIEAFGDAKKRGKDMKWDELLD